MDISYEVIGSKSEKGISLRINHIKEKMIERRATQSYPQMLMLIKLVLKTDPSNWRQVRDRVIGVLNASVDDIQELMSIIDIVEGPELGYSLSVQKSYMDQVKNITLTRIKLLRIIGERFGTKYSDNCKLKMKPITPLVQFGNGRAGNEVT